MSTNNSDRQNKYIKILKATSKLSLGTFISRILGFVRMIFLAKILGTSFYADAFFMGFRLPNLFRDMVGEGATNAAVVPVMTEHLEKDDRQKFWELVNIVLTTAFFILSAITILFIIFTPAILKVLVPGFAVDPAKFILTVKLTRIMFPYLILIGMTAYLMGILYTFRSFSVPALSPSLLNIAIICGALIAPSINADPTVILAYSVLIGGALQLLAHIPPLKKVGMKFSFPRTFSHPGANKIGRLMIPRMIGSGVYQLNVLVDSFCASLSSIVGPGGISAISFSSLLINFPIGIVATSLSSAMLPELSRDAALKDHDAAARTINSSLRWIMLIMIPASIITFFASGFIVKILFQRGMFDVYSTQITSNALAFYSIGLTAFCANKILITAFYAFQDTKTPLKIAIISLILNAVLNLILMHPLKVGGITLSSSIAGIVNFGLLYYLLKKRLKVEG
jgi:putative peptidoglycan lipid II flippase